MFALTDRFAEVLRVLLAIVALLIYAVSPQATTTGCGTCESLGYNCGNAVDNCGQPISCGPSDCKLGDNCFGDYPAFYGCAGYCDEASHQCDCGTCQLLDIMSQCGDGSDACGRPCRIECSGGGRCELPVDGSVSYVCVAPPVCGTCSSLGYQCAGPDGCGNTITCGSCAHCCRGMCYAEAASECEYNSPLGRSTTCYTCSSLGLECGERPATQLDEHMFCTAVDCGPCPSGRTCVVNKCVAQTTSTGTTSTGTTSTGITSTGTTSTGTTSTGTSSTGTTSTGTTSTATPSPGTTSAGTSSSRTTSIAASSSSSSSSAEAVSTASMGFGSTTGLGPAVQACGGPCPDGQACVRTMAGSYNCTDCATIRNLTGYACGTLPADPYGRELDCDCPASLTCQFSADFRTSYCAPPLGTSDGGGAMLGGSTIGPTTLFDTDPFINRTRRPTTEAPLDPALQGVDEKPKSSAAVDSRRASAALLVLAVLGLATAFS